MLSGLCKVADLSALLWSLPMSARLWPMSLSTVWSMRSVLSTLFTGVLSSAIGTIGGSATLSPYCDTGTATFCTCWVCGTDGAVLSTMLSALLSATLLPTLSLLIDVFVVFVWCFVNAMCPCLM